MANREKENTKGRGEGKEGGREGLRNFGQCRALLTIFNGADDWIMTIQTIGARYAP